MRALGNPRVPVKVWKECGLFRNHKRNTREALANFKRSDKKRARREGRAETQAQVDDMQNLRALSIEELRDLAASYTSVLPDALLYELHYRLWDWLAQNPGQPKYDWPYWDGEYRKFGGHFINAGCFLCRYTAQRETKEELMRCRECPMHRLSRQYGHCYCWAFSQWDQESDDYDAGVATMWAMRIRNCVKRG